MEVNMKCQKNLKIQNTEFFLSVFGLPAFVEVTLKLNFLYRPTVNKNFNIFLG